VDLHSPVGDELHADVLEDGAPGRVVGGDLGLNLVDGEFGERGLDEGGGVSGA
jgi:hypothetical protein